MAITLSDETKNALIESIRRYFDEERAEEIGELQASMFLEFVLLEVGPSIYNQGVKDAQAAMQHWVADLDLTLFEAEFGHSAEKGWRR